MNQPDRARRLCAIPLFAVALALIVSLALPSIARAQSSDATLSSLSLSDGITLMPEFDKDTHTYTASVDNSVSNTTLMYEETHNMARTRLGLGGGASFASDFTTINLGVGTNIITLTVTAQDSTERVYTVTITRAAPPRPAACPTTTETQEQVCNLGVASASANAPVGFDGVQAGVQRWANTFTVGSATHGYDLASVSLAFTSGFGSPGNLVVAIHEVASDGFPAATALGTLSGTNPSGSAATIVYTASNITLKANFTYWLVLSAPDAPTDSEARYTFARAGAATAFADTGWSIGDRASRAVGSGAYRERSGGTPLKFAVVATPATLIVPTTPPAPTGVTATARDASITVRWTAGTGVTGQPAATGHHVCAILASTPAFAGLGSCVQSATVDTPAAIATITGLTNGTPYKIAVRSFENNAFENSEWVEADAAVTPMAFSPNNDLDDGRLYSFAAYAGADTSGTELVLTPAFATGTSDYAAPRPAAGVTQVTIEFQTHSARTQSFVAFTNSSGADITGVSNGAGTHTFTLPSGNAAYFLALTYEDGNGNPDGNVRLEFPAAPTTPPAPTGVMAMAGDASITVRWTAGTAVSGQPTAESHTLCAILATETDFPDDVTSCAASAAVNTPATTAMLTGLTNDTGYRVAVRGDDGSGEVSAWEEASGTHTPLAALRLRLRVFLESALP